MLYSNEHIRIPPTRFVCDGLAGMLLQLATNLVSRTAHVGTQIIKAQVLRS